MSQLLRIIDPHEESLETPLESYFAIKVVLKNTSKVMEQLNECFQMENDRHLKRIRKIKDESHVVALLCKSSPSEDSNELRSKLERLEIPFDDILIVEVPIRRPITKKQYEAWNAIWPLVFHESMDEKLKMKQLVENSKLFSIFRSHFIDNKLSILIVESVSTLTLTDNITSEELHELIIYESSTTEIVCNDDRGHSYPFDHFVLKSLNGFQPDKRITRNNKIPYLLSGCTAILSHEPCVMCAMALLHSRIDAVVYLERNEVSGALGSNCFLHSIDSLNHHFPVFTIKQ